jgi:hypothetical protein
VERPGLCFEVSACSRMANNVLLLFVSCRDPSFVVGTGWSWDSSSQLGQLPSGCCVQVRKWLWLWLCRVYTHSPLSASCLQALQLLRVPRQPHIFTHVCAHAPSRVPSVCVQRRPTLWPNMQ